MNLSDMPIQWPCCWAMNVAWASELAVIPLGGDMEGRGGVGGEAAAVGSVNVRLAATVAESRDGGD